MLKFLSSANILLLQEMGKWIYNKIKEELGLIKKHLNNVLTAVNKLIAPGFKFNLFVTKVQSSVNTYWHTYTEQQNKKYLYMCVYETMYSQMDQVKVVEGSL